MTDLLHRLAARATGHRHGPTTVPLLPPRLAAERLSGEHLGPSVEDGASEDAGSWAAAPARDDGQDGRGTGAARFSRDDRPVAVPAGPSQAPPLAALPVVQAAPPPSPIAAPPVRQESTDAGGHNAGRDPGPPRRHHASAVAAPLATATPPVGAPPPAGHRGGVPAAPDEPVRRGPRPSRRPVAPERENARPARREAAPAVPVARPVPVATPVPLTLAPRSVEPPSVASTEVPAVTISIGRVEIRAVPPAPHTPSKQEPGPRATSGRSFGTLSLGEFLRGTGDAR